MFFNSKVTAYNSESLRDIRLLATFCSKSNIVLGNMSAAPGPLHPHPTPTDELCGS